MSITHERELQTRPFHGWDSLYISMIPLPTALLCGALLGDALFWLTAAGAWARVSEWLLIGGLASGLVAAADGLLRYVSLGCVRSSRIGWVHVCGNILALLLTTSNLVYRWVDDSEHAVLPAGIALSAAVVCVLLATAWIGRGMYDGIPEEEVPGDEEDPEDWDSFW